VEKALGTSGVTVGRTAGALLVGVLAALLLASTAHGNTRTLRDRNDVPGPLDIRSATAGHKGGHLLRHTISTFAGWPSSLIGIHTPNFLALGLDTHGNSTFDNYVFFYSKGGRIRAILTDRRGDAHDRLHAYRPNHHAVGAFIPRGDLDIAGGYRWKAFTVFRSAGGDIVDALPRGNAALHDITAPNITLIEFPNPSTVQSLNFAFAVRFRVSDPGHKDGRSAGMKWRLESRSPGTPTWTTVTSGTTTLSQRVEISGEEGKTYFFWVVAWDRHKNRRVSPIQTVSVPYDDANPVFASAFTGAWHPSGICGGPCTFMDTLRATAEAGAKFTYTFNGSYVAWIGPELGPGTAEVSIDSGPAQPVVLPDTLGEIRAILFEAGGLDPGVPHTITITLDSGGMFLDGIVIR
jgi:hypothetical protein